MSTQSPAHLRLVDSAASYVLGALSAAEHREFEAHLGECAECRQQVQAFRPAVAALPYAAPDVAPPPALRDRVLAIAKPDARSRAVAPFPAPRSSSWAATGGWLSAAALLVVAIGAAGYATALRRELAGLGQQLTDTRDRLERTEVQLETTVRALGSAQVRMAVLTAPDLLRIDLRGQPPAPGASGRGFWSRTAGLIFAASDLPPLPAGRVYQLWVLPPGGAAPVSAGVLSLEPDGSVSAALETPQAPTAPAGMAVSIEPTGGVPAPTGALYLVGLAE